ncbi:MAG TPA: hypothetical protein EYH31_13950 [Anaerolineae bacterium]|nr:hypothetical protein [Anaerolineae bacterium]
MTMTIALAGKGGTGKTSIAALLIRYLIENRMGTILAIDADPSSNLNMALGLPLTKTVGDIREDLLSETQAGGAGGMARRDYLEYQIRMAVEEGDEVDLLAMGRPEGPGCYCAANYMLRQITDQLGTVYDYVVMDNEAGMEHLSRRTTRDVDVLVLITDPTVRGLVAAERMLALKDELEIGVGYACLIVNRVNGDLPSMLCQKIESLGVPLMGIVPNDPLLAEFDAMGQPLVELPNHSIAWQAIKQMAPDLVRAGVRV